MMKIAILLDNFGHDGNGNPVARHTVFSYAKEHQPLDAPTEKLYQTKVRQQVGYSSRRNDWAGTALEKAKVTDATLMSTEGDRSSDAMWLVYQVTKLK